jgi:agmatinase
VDLFDLDFGKAYEHGFYLREISQGWISRNDELKKIAKSRKALLEQGEEQSPAAIDILEKINLASLELNQWVEIFAKEVLEAGKIPAVLGGDHSSPYGLIKAVSDHFAGDLGILHLDAHADLRNSYQGYQHSHASIMHNVMQNLKISKLVQVGIRDFCEEEFDFIRNSAGRIKTHFDSDLQRRLLSGETWLALTKEIIAELPQQIYISFDIDGLEPSLCPNTGTPVPGGINFAQVGMLFSQIALAGKKIVGFDLNEVSPGSGPATERRSAAQPDAWDANVGARILFKLCGLAAHTNSMPSKG